jgi:chemotaxis protein CheX
VSAGPLVGRGDLAEMVELIWASYLDPEGLRPLVPTGDETQPCEVHASVSISGAWTGHLVYASSALGARRAAAAFLAVSPAEVSPADVSDVLGELANIVGGNVKAMLPPGCLLSLPRVVLAPASAIGYPDAERLTGLYGVWEGEPVSVSMWQSRDRAGAMAG